MYNYFMLIGVVYKDFEIKEVGDGVKVVNIPLAVRREFQNSNGEYDYDKFTVSLWEVLAQVAIDNVKKGSKIGVKGRISPKLVTLENGFKTYKNQLVADRIVYFGESELTEFEDRISKAQDTPEKQKEESQEETKKTSRKSKKVVESFED